MGQGMPDRVRETLAAIDDALKQAEGRHREVTIHDSAGLTDSISVVVHPESAGRGTAIDASAAVSFSATGTLEIVGVALAGAGLPAEVTSERVDEAESWVRGMSDAVLANVVAGLIGAGLIAGVQQVWSRDYLEFLIEVARYALDR